MEADDPEYELFGERLKAMMDPTSCAVCSRTFPNVGESNNHYKSKKHRGFVRNWLKRERIINYRNSLMTMRLCQICSKRLPEIPVAKQHYNSKMHKKAAERWLERELNPLTERYGKRIRNILRKINRPTAPTDSGHRWTAARTINNEVCSNKDVPIKIEIMDDEEIPINSKIINIKELTTNKDPKYEVAINLELTKDFIPILKDKFFELIKSSNCQICGTLNDFHAETHYNSERHKDKVEQWYQHELQNVTGKSSENIVADNSTSALHLQSRLLSDIGSQKGGPCSESIKQDAVMFRDQLLKATSLTQCQICNQRFKNSDLAKLHYDSDFHFNSVKTWWNMASEFEESLNLDESSFPLPQDIEDAINNKLDFLMQPETCNICRVNLNDSYDHYTSESHCSFVYNVFYEAVMAKIKKTHGAENLPDWETQKDIKILPSNRELLQHALKSIQMGINTVMTKFYCNICNTVFKDVSTAGGIHYGDCEDHKRNFSMWFDENLFNMISSSWKGDFEDFCRLNFVREKIDLLCSPPFCRICGINPGHEKLRHQKNIKKWKLFFITEHKTNVNNILREKIENITKASNNFSQEFSNFLTHADEHDSGKTSLMKQPSTTNQQELNNLLASLGTKCEFLYNDVFCKICNIQLDRDLALNHGKDVLHIFKFSKWFDGEVEMAITGFSSSGRYDLVAVLKARNWVEDKINSLKRPTGCYICYRLYTGKLGSFHYDCKKLHRKRETVLRNLLKKEALDAQNAVRLEEQLLKDLGADICEGLNPELKRLYTKLATRWSCQICKTEITPITLFLHYTSRIHKENFTTWCRSLVGPQ